MFNATSQNQMKTVLLIFTPLDDQSAYDFSAKESAWRSYGQYWWD